MKRLFSILAAVVMPAVPAAAQYVNPANGHTYWITPNATTWSQAEAYAVSVGGHLATVRNAAEQQWLQDTILQGPSAKSAFWIGLRRTSPGGPFAWVSGAPLTYTNWHSGEPNNACAGEPVVAMNWHLSEGYPGSPGDWNDTPDGGIHYGDCNSAGTVPYRGIVEVPCLPDFNDDGFMDVFDFVAFVDCFNGEACPPGKSADYNNDGFADIFDFVDFVTDFENGC